MTARRRALGLVVVLALSPLAIGLPGAAAAPVVELPIAEVPTDVETPVLFDDEAGGNASGDDPAIWVHPTHPGRSLILATAKEGGLRVYDLDGGRWSATGAWTSFGPTPLILPAPPPRCR